MSDVCRLHRYRQGTPRLLATHHRTPFYDILAVTSDQSLSKSDARHSKSDTANGRYL